jgi:hypothetical protein
MFEWAWMRGSGEMMALRYIKGKRTSVGSEPKSVVTPTCSLHNPSACLHRPQWPTSSLCDGQQIISVHTSILANLVVCAYPACIDHDATLLVGFWVQQVVAFRAEVEGRLPVPDKDEFKGIEMRSAMAFGKGCPNTNHAERLHTTIAKFQRWRRNAEQAGDLFKLR